MKEKLTKLYSSKLNAFKLIRDTFPNDDLAGPFLMSPNILYGKQKNKLMIIGQQTKGWSYDHKNINNQLEAYEEFNVGENYYASPFWNITRKLEKTLGNDMLSCAWTNLNKFDLDEDRPYGEYEKAIAELDSILIDEIDILKPNICMFYTGPDFDNRLKDIFTGLNFIEIDGWNIRQFCKLGHEKLPENSYRSYHPKSLRIQHLEERFISQMRNFHLYKI